MAPNCAPFDAKAAASAGGPAGAFDALPVSRLTDIRRDGGPSSKAHPAIYWGGAAAGTPVDTFVRQTDVGGVRALAPCEFSMTDYFQRQLAYYAAAHRDRVNSIMHMIGNPILFVAVVLPLCLLPVHVFGVQTSAGSLLVIPALLLWMAWDIAIGLAIVVVSIPLLFVAHAIASHVGVISVWIIAIGLFVLGWALQIIGHQLFEGKRPTLLDNPVQMLISPMHIFAKLFVALGLRPDLAAVLQKSQQTPLGSPSYPVERRADAGRTP
jgi:uncharacterized membrane protein YGL010W